MSNTARAIKGPALLGRKKQLCANLCFSKQPLSFRGMVGYVYGQLVVGNLVHGLGFKFVFLMFSLKQYTSYWEQMGEIGYGSNG